MCPFYVYTCESMQRNKRRRILSETDDHVNLAPGLHGAKKPATGELDMPEQRFIFKVVV
jgi:hypothetical protein